MYKYQISTNQFINTVWLHFRRVAPYDILQPCLVIKSQSWESAWDFSLSLHVCCNHMPFLRLFLRNNKNSFTIISFCLSNNNKSSVCSPLVAWLLMGVGLGACLLEGWSGGESELSLYEYSSPRLPSSPSGLWGAEQGSLLSHVSLLLLLLLLPWLDHQCCCKISPPSDACWHSSPAMDSMPWMAQSVLGEVGRSLWTRSSQF